jgi:hypothetical protein
MSKALMNDHLIWSIRAYVYLVPPNSWSSIYSRKRKNEVVGANKGSGVLFDRPAINDCDVKRRSTHTQPTWEHVIENS